MKNVACFLTLALIVGCEGGADQAAIAPEKKAELDATMQDDMKKMTGELSQNPDTPKPEAEAK
ncbi:MAG: hypothetical protein WCO86_02415 [Planctomycetota bacterium]|nr:hypothetical protein [Planctomycetales bacterium]